MQGSKRSTNRSWLHGRDPESQRAECKYSVKPHKKYLNRKARHNKKLPNKYAYKKLTKEKVWEYASWKGNIMGKLYVAYGSNLNLAQMAARCPSAKIYAKGVLNNWELVYRGRKANSHATIIRKKGSTVPVLVWEIQPVDEYRLDIYEGCPRYYSKQNIMVSIAERKKAMVYIMDKEQMPGRPSSQYVNAILQGYVDNDMDISVLKNSLEINAIECM